MPENGKFVIPVRVGALVSIVAVLMTAGAGVWKLAAEFGAVQAELKDLDRRVDWIEDYIIQNDDIVGPR